MAQSTISINQVLAHDIMENKPLEESKNYNHKPARNWIMGAGGIQEAVCVKFLIFSKNQVMVIFQST